MTPVTVVSPAQAVAAIINLVDALIASTVDAAALRPLRQARKALAGDVSGFGNDGALHKLQEQQTAAALAHLSNALADLRLAQAAGADVTMLIGLIEEVVAALEKFKSSGVQGFRGSVVQGFGFRGSRVSGGRVLNC